MLSINTNLSSLIAQNSLKSSSLKLDQAIERMTTGYKINHAKDNAANYSIATNMTTKIGAYQVAEDNALQGLDMINVATETLNSMSKSLEHLRGLAVQAQNNVYSEQSILAINQEANAIISESSKLYDSTAYNGVKLLDASASFLLEVEKIDTASMIKFSEVDSDVEISSGEYSIASASDLQKLGQMVEDCLITGGQFVLATNISLAGFTSWAPIGSEMTPFVGTFDGNGYVISDLHINDSSLNYAGLFGKSTGSILNLGLKDVNINAGEYVGALGGDLKNVSNCYVEGDIRGSKYVGGLAGVITDASISDCYVKANITGNSNVGGFFASCSTKSIVDKCFADINVSGQSSIGGFAYLVGGVGTQVTNSSVKGAVVATGDNVGGFVSDLNNSHLTSCFAEVSVSGNSKIGGFARLCNYSTITSCYVIGNVKGNSTTSGFVNHAWSGNVISSYCSLDESSRVDAIYLMSYQGAGGNINNCYVDSKNSDITLTTVSHCDITNHQYYSEEHPFTYDELKPLTTVRNISFRVNTISSESFSIYFTTDFDLTTELYNLATVSIADENYISNIDKINNKINEKLVEYGSVQCRLESALDEISIQYENLVSSRSTIRDVDMAEVSSDYIRQQILQQASATLMSTTNQSPSIALQLI